MKVLKCGGEYIAGTNADGFAVWTTTPEEALRFDDAAVECVEPFPIPAEQPTGDAVDAPIVIQVGGQPFAMV